jgi:hypothetical protein
LQPEKIERLRRAASARVRREEESHEESGSVVAEAAAGFYLSCGSESRLRKRRQQIWSRRPSIL